MAQSDTEKSLQDASPAEFEDLSKSELVAHATASDHSNHPDEANYLKGWRLHVLTLG